MKRRAIVKAGLGVIALGAAAAAFRPWRLLRSAVRKPSAADLEGPDAFARGLRRALPMLKLDDAVLAAFIADMRRHKRPMRVKKSGRAKLDDVQKLLLSTDFFQRGADESRELRYLAFYDPYVTPCYNPLHQADRADASG